MLGQKTVECFHIKQTIFCIVRITYCKLKPSPIFGFVHERWNNVVTSTLKMLVCRSSTGIMELFGFYVCSENTKSTWYLFPTAVHFTPFISTLLWPSKLNNYVHVAILKEFDRAESIEFTGRGILKFPDRSIQRLYFKMYWRRKNSWASYQCETILYNRFHVHLFFTSVLMHWKMHPQKCFIFPNQMYPMPSLT